MDLRRPLHPAAAFGIAAASAVLMAALEYLWIERDTALAGDLLGIPFIAAWIAPLVVVLFFVRFDWRSTAAWKAVLGGPGLWILACLVPGVLFGGGVYAFSAAGGKVDPDWRWITLAWSALFDFPFMLVALMPMLAGVLGALALIPALVLRGRAAAGASLLVALLAVLGQVPLLLHALDGRDAAYAGALGGLILGTAAFAYRILVRGAFIPAAAGVLMTLNCVLLLNGSDVSALTHAVVGFDVDTIKPFIPPVSPFFRSLPAIAGGAMLLISFLIPAPVRD